MNNQSYKISKISKNVSKQEGLSFLRELDKYIEIIINDDFLTNVIDHMFNTHEQESIDLMRKLNRIKSDLDAYSVKNEIEERISEKYPTHHWRQLLIAQSDYQHVKHYETEEDIPDATIVIPEQTSENFTVYASQKNLKSIPRFVELFGWQRNFQEFNTGFLKLIDEIEQNGGIFSKYFDYNPDSGILYFQGSEIQINERKKITNANHLLTFLFANEPFEQHFYSELEEHEALLEPKHWSSYHKACIDIQNKVLAKTDVSDFLDFNSGSKMYVRINPVYSTYKATS
jgi:hypothetical protein